MLAAKDLRKEPPRSPRVRVGGYALLARMVDKGRATLNETNGEYHFACPVDQRLFDFKGVQEEAVKDLLASGADDGQVAAWFDKNGTPKTAEEIKAWSDIVDSARPDDDPETQEWFAGECARLGLNPSTTTMVEYLEADDRDTFKTV
jgi:hypothetical protein